MSAAWGFEIAIRIAGIIVGVGKSVAVIEEEFDGLYWNCKTEPFAKGDFHVGDANHFAAHVEQRSAAVARVDLRGGLEIKLATELSRFGAKNAFGHGAFKAKRAADGEHAFTDGQGIGVAHDDVFKFGNVFVFDFQEREIFELIHRDDADLFVSLTLENTIWSLVIDFDRDLSFAFDDVEVRHKIAVFVDNETGTEPAGRADLNNRFTELGNEFANGLGWKSFIWSGVKAGSGFGDSPGFNGGFRFGNRGFGFGAYMSRRLRILGNFSNLVARYEENCVADINSDLVAFLGEDGADDGSFIFKLDSIAKRALERGESQESDSNRLF